jgi:hypothetical protein
MRGGDNMSYNGGWGNGYDGISMSWNARDAYASGERPLSRWSKADIVESVKELNPDIDISRLNMKTIRAKFLVESGWHHTGMYYQKTYFYFVDDDYVGQLTQADVDELYREQLRSRRK